MQIGEEEEVIEVVPVEQPVSVPAVPIEEQPATAPGPPLEEPIGVPA